MKNRFSIALLSALLINLCLSFNLSLALDDESIPDLLRERRERSVGKRLEDKIVLKILEPYTNAKKWLNDKAKLEIAMQQFIIYQSATGGRNPNDTAISNSTFFGQWHLVDHPSFGKGSLGYYIERRDNVSFLLCLLFLVLSL